MLSHNQIKYVNSLKIKKFRQKERAFIAEGEKCVEELLSSHFRIINIYALPEWITKYSKLIQSKQLEIQEITSDELKKISDLVTPNQILAVAEIPFPDSEYIYTPGTISIMLDGIRDPGNMGTILRTADWFGIKKLICSTDSVDIFNPKVVQASMGSIGRVEASYLDLELFLKQISPEIPVYGALLHAPSITEKKFTKAGIILVGSESHGISEKLIPFINEPVHIPRFSFSDSLNKTESLNASIANGIICYEICKQLSLNYF